jgi:hypothetical protein
MRKHHDRSHPREFPRAAWERSTGAGSAARLRNDPRSIPLRAMLCLDPVIW